jgi:hypothetical protein
VVNPGGLGDSRDADDVRKHGVEAFRTLIVERDLLFDRESVDEVADRLTAVRGAIVDGAKALRLAGRRQADTLLGPLAGTGCG